MSIYSVISLYSRLINEVGLTEPQAIAIVELAFASVKVEYNG